MIEIIILIILVGILSGILGSLLGLGGAIVLIPFLTIFLNVHAKYAAGSALIATIATSSGSASAYLIDRLANFRIGMSLEITTTAGAIIGSLIAGFIFARNLEWIFYLLFSFILFTSILPTERKLDSELPTLRNPDRSTKIFKLEGSYFDEKIGKEIKYYGVRWWLAEFIMFFAGIISGLLGIGSGALKVLALDWAMNLPLKVSTATSNFMIGVTASTGSAIYWSFGYIEPLLSSSAALGVLIGSFIGSKLIQKLSSFELRIIFLSILAFLGMNMLLRGLIAIKMIVLSKELYYLISIIFAVLFAMINYFIKKK